MEYVIHDGYQGYVTATPDNDFWKHSTEKGKAKRFTEDEIDNLYPEMSMEHPLSETNIIDIESLDEWHSKFGNKLI